MMNISVITNNLVGAAYEPWFELKGKKLGVATPDGETLISTGDNDGNGGMLNLVGVGMFQMILFVLYNQDHVSIDMNFACARS